MGTFSGSNEQNDYKTSREIVVLKAKAAILIEQGKPLELLELEIPVLKKGQVLVEIHTSGLCRTQIMECQGLKGVDPYLPHGLGHEGFGVVREVGSEVVKVKPSDRVILSWIKGSGIEAGGTVYRSGDRTVNAGAITTFADFAVISENRLTVAPPHLSALDAAFLGCAGLTGFGAIAHSMKGQIGESVAIFGCGGIGLSAIAAAKLLGLPRIVAADTNSQKKELAHAFGATEFVNLAEVGFRDWMDRTQQKPFDGAVDATGVPAVMESLLSIVRVQGGRAVVLGNAPKGSMISIDTGLFNQGKSLLGSWGGDSNPDRDLPFLCEKLLAQAFSYEPLQSAQYKLEEVNRALSEFAAGKVARPILVMKS